MANKFAFLIAATICSATILAAEQQPSNWNEFKASKHKEDVALVAKITKSNWWTVCEKFGRLRRTGKETREFVAYREFMIDDKLINGKDLMHISSREVAIGMTACGVFASIGLPERSNRTTTAVSTRQQLVFQKPHRYVYVEDSKASNTGLVTAIQD